MEIDKPFAPKNIQFEVNDLVEVCVNESLDIWVLGTFLGKDSTMDLCFIETKKNKFLSIRPKFVRFCKNNEENKLNPNDIKMDDIKRFKSEEKTDEWENQNNFVLTQYIQDVFVELPNLLSNLDEFMKRMEFLGVYSAKSRARALSILETMKRDKEDRKLLEKIKKEDEMKEKEQRKLNLEKRKLSDAFLATELANKLKDGHTFDIFNCMRCGKKQEFGGVELRNCSHKICYKCLIDWCKIQIAQNKAPKCLQCQLNIHPVDISIHVGIESSKKVEELSTEDYLGNIKNLYRCYSKQCDGVIIIENPFLKQFNCPKCNIECCLECKNFHQIKGQCPSKPKPKPKPLPKPKPIIFPNIPFNFGIHGSLNNKDFRSNWVNVGDKLPRNMNEAFDVPINSTEWKIVTSHLRDLNRRKIFRMQRIQNAKVWIKYESYCQSLENKGKNVRCGGYWHGTRTCKPAIIWKGYGFDKSKSRVGGCLWFAVDNTYSMNGFQHPLGKSGQSQIFLAMVACGDKSHVKFIRSNKILNVYKNDCTYPAYLLTYT